MKLEDFHSDTALLTDTYKTLDLFSSCIFTGAPVGKRNGEHVIPRWMLNDYHLKNADVELSQTGKTCSPLEFRAPATSHANMEFGKLENKVKLGTATKDEIHIWSRKISVGIMLNHHRMSLNFQHPQSPVTIDERFIRSMLQHFHSDFGKWKNGSYKKDGAGSVIKLKTAYDKFFFAHLSGAMIREDISDTYDVMAPYGLIAIGRNNELIISTYGDEDMQFETPEFIEKLESSGVIKSKDKNEIRCFLAVSFFDGPFNKLFKEFHGFEPQLCELELLGYQLGIQISETGGELTYRDRNSPNKQVEPIFFTTRTHE